MAEKKRFVRVENWMKMVGIMNNLEIEFAQVEVLVSTSPDVESAELELAGAE